MAPIDDPKYDVFHEEGIDRDTSMSWDLVKMPMESIEGNTKGDIRFVVDASDRYWMDMNNACIRFEARIVKEDRSKFDTANDGKYCFVNNAAHSLFQDLRVKVNETQVFGGTMDYHYIAYMSNHLQYTHGPSNPPINSRSERLLWCLLHILSY